MCWTCDLVGAVAKIKKVKVSMGACSLLCGHNIDKYDRWLDGYEQWWDEDGIQHVIQYPTAALIEATKKIYAVLGLLPPSGTGTLAQLEENFRIFRIEESHESDPAEIAKRSR